MLPDQGGLLGAVGRGEPMTRLYANTTAVTPAKSKAEIESVLRRYGADKSIAALRTPEPEVPGRKALHRTTARR